MICRTTNLKLHHVIVITEKSSAKIYAENLNAPHLLAARNRRELNASELPANLPISNQTTKIFRREKTQKLKVTLVA